ncbi:MAG: hypothetical protein M1830_003486 [Pleopsidium flavum]|nr:MAG: hypothetical protein M1830_003486 [Pleopsidium flavum]
MAKTKPLKKSSKRNKSVLNGTTVPRTSSASKKSTEDPATLLGKATSLLHTSQPNEALDLAQRALVLLQPSSTSTQSTLPALNLIAEAYVELGDIDAARGYFLRAIESDPEGEVAEVDGGGADKFLWLAQLCEDGGAESVQWFEKGATVLRREIGALEAKAAGPDSALIAQDKRRKLANALCGVIEVYMTDLSWEEDAEARCEKLVTEALLVAPHTPEPFQTLASVRISQVRLEDAKTALSRSMELWKDLPPEDPDVPDFPTRISLSRLLMEAQMEEDALEVLERLVGEDDSSVEAWYLGGWCLFMMGENRRERMGGVAPADGDTSNDCRALMVSSRDWLQNSLKLYEIIDYEDDRLKDHALELVQGLETELGEVAGIEDGSGDEEWEDEVEAGESDEEMNGI